MQRSQILRWSAPVVLLVSAAGSVMAQESSAPPLNPARELEAEIEDYPAPDGTVTSDSNTPGSTPASPVKGSAASDEATRIPEQIHRPGQGAPRGPAAASGPRGAPQSAASAVPSAEVQRVLGRDVGILDLNSLTPPQVTRLQQRLREEGLYHGTLDGVVGPKTRAALSAAVARQQQLSQRLLQQGQITTQLGTQIGVLRYANSGRPVWTPDLEPSPTAEPTPAPAPPALESLPSSTPPSP
jgi:hypothetical protein